VREYGQEKPVSEQPIETDEYDDPNESSVIKKLRAEAKLGREAAARAEAAEKTSREAQRELAMRRAGVDVDSPLGAMFNKAWDGEINVDDMRAGWEQVAGNVPPAQQSPDQAALQRIASASGGSQASGGAPIDFENELNSIPIMVDGQYNPDYVTQVLSKTAEQAAREGRQFSTDGRGARSWSNSSGSSSPAIKPL
jgi:hypothetical protein